MEKSMRKSYTAGFKLRVVEYSAYIDKVTNRERGVSATVKEFPGLSERLIYRWRHDKAILEAMPRAKRKTRPRKARFPQMEKNLRAWVLSERSKNRKVSTVFIRREAIKMARRANIVDFKGGDDWCQRFMARERLSVRAVTSVGQKLPPNWEELMAKFRQHVKDLVRRKGIMNKDLCNMDEIPVSFDMPSRYTVDKIGSQDISIATTGNEKNCFTVVLTVLKNGQKCKPMVVFKRKTMPKVRFPEGILVRCNPKGWMNEDLMNEWVEEVWLKRRNPAKDDKSGSILDSASCHLTEIAKDAVKSGGYMFVIPGGMTKKLQPLDISVNKSFKSKLQYKWECWMIDDARHSYTKGRHQRHASLDEICEWILEAWNEIMPECIRNGFRKALGEEDASESADELFGEEHQEMDAIPEDVLQNFENLEFVADDEFDGFMSDNEEMDRAGPSTPGIKRNTLPWPSGHETRNWEEIVRRKPASGNLLRMFIMLFKKC